MGASETKLLRLRGAAYLKAEIVKLPFVYTYNSAAWCPQPTLLCLLEKAIRYSMKILITGVCCDVGLHLSKHLIDQGHAVVGFDIRRSDDLPASIVFEEGDVRDLSSLKRVARGCNTGIHLAIQAGNDNDLMDVNVSGAYGFVVAARENGFRNAVLASSAPVHLDGTDNRILLRTSESDDHAYDLSKVLQEIVFRDFHAHGSPAMCLRFGHIVRGKKSVNLSNPIPLTDFDYCRGGWVALEDVVIACAKALVTSPDREAFEIFNVIGARTAREKFNVEIVEQRLGFKFKYDFAEYE